MEKPPPPANLGNCEIFVFSEAGIFSQQQQKLYFLSLTNSFEEFSHFKWSDHWCIYTLYSFRNCDDNGISNNTQREHIRLKFNLWPPHVHMLLSLHLLGRLAWRNNETVKIIQMSFRIVKEGSGSVETVGGI